MNAAIYQHVGVSICNCGEPPNMDLVRDLIDEFSRLTTEVDSKQQGTHHKHRTMYIVKYTHT